MGIYSGARRGKEEIHQVEYLGYHLDSNLSEEFLAMKKFKIKMTEKNTM